MRWIIILIIIVAIIIYLASQQESGKPASRTQPPTPTVQAMPAAQPAPAMQQQPQAEPQAEPDRTELFRQAAQAAHVELRNVEPQPGGANVTVSWKSDVATLGGDFIEQCIRLGAIRDYDVDKVKYNQTIEDERTTHYAQFAVRY